MKRLKFLILLMTVMGLYSIDAAAQSTTFTYPANPDECIELKPTFDWEYTGPNTVGQYTLQVSKSTDFTNLIIDEDALTVSEYEVTMDLEYNTIYYWRTVTEFVPSGSEISNTATFSTLQDAPELTTPTNTESCLPLDNIIFEWQSLGVGDYEIDIATSNTFGATSLAGYPMSEAQASHTFSTGPLTKNTQYYWRVRADFGAPCNWTAWSDTLIFRTEADPPVLSGPPDNDECLYSNAKYWWAPIPGASSYDIEFSTTALFGDDVIYTRETWSSNTFTMPNGVVDAYTDYYWHVKANFTGSCETDWSADWKFKTSQFPPDVVYPQVNDKGVLLEPEFYWEVDDALTLPETFHMQVATDVNFTNLVYDEAAIPSATISSTTFTLDSPPLDYNKNYWMRLRAQYWAPDNCQTDWTQTIPFKTTFPMALGENPEDGTTCVDLEYEFTWRSVPQANTFRLQVSRNEDMSDPEVDEANIGALKKKVTLEDGMATYYWRVRGEDASTYGIWSPVLSFTTTNSPPAAVEPENNQTGLPLDVTFVWESISEDAEYDFKLSKFQNMDEPIVSRTGLTSNTFSASVPDYFEKYYWSVKGTGNGCTSDWSNPVSFQTAIPAPMLVAPMDNSTKQPLLPTFSWDESPAHGVEYEFQLAKSDVFDELVDGRTNIPVNSTSAGVKLETNTLYFWRVRAFTGTGTSAWSQTFRFTTGEEGPEVPMLLSPSDKATDTEITLTLRWNASDRATGYKLQVSTTERFVTNIYDIAETDNLTDTIYEVTGLENFRQYYWRVAGVNDFGTSAWSDVWEFKTKGAPPAGAPNLVNPFKGVSSVPVPVTFSWDPVTNASEYELQLTTNSTTFTVEDMIVNPTIKAPKTSFPFSDLDLQTTYYWRVRAINNAGIGPWSETWSFTTSPVSVHDELAGLYNFQVMPNPAVDKAMAYLFLPKAEKVKITVYNTLGEKLDRLYEGVLGAGDHSVPWNASAYQNGIYMFVIEIGDFRQMKQVVLTR